MAMMAMMVSTEPLVGGVSVTLIGIVAAILSFISLLFIARHVFDNGFAVPIPFWRGRYFMRRYASPSGRCAEELRVELVELCRASLSSRVHTETLVRENGQGDDEKTTLKNRKNSGHAKDGDENGMDWECVDKEEDVPLPHRFLHDPSHMRNKFILVAYDRLNNNEPAMFHAMFKSEFATRLSLHLGLVVVHPSHRRKGLQVLSSLNTVLTFLSLLSPSFILTDVGDSPSGSRLLTTFTTSCLPNYRHSLVRAIDNNVNCNCNRSITAQGEGNGNTSFKSTNDSGMKWQKQVLRFMMAEHRRDFGTSIAAQADEDIFVIRRSNMKEGGGSHALMNRNDEKRSKRDDGANAFMRNILNDDDDEVFHVCACSLQDLAFRMIMMNSRSIRVVATVWMFCLRIPWIVVGTLLDRMDILLNAFVGWIHSNALSLEVYKESDEFVEKGVLDRELNRLLDVDLIDRSCARNIVAGATKEYEQIYPLWISNHFNWFDYGILTLLCSKKLPTIYKSDLQSEGIFAKVLLMIHRMLNSITYVRGDKSSGRDVRGQIADALTRGPVHVFPEGTSQEEGPPLPLHSGAIRIAYEKGSPVQPIALYYSESCGVGRHTNPVLATSNLLRHPTQCIVYFTKMVYPEEFDKADNFVKVVEEELNKAYCKIARKYTVQ